MLTLRERMDRMYPDLSDAQRFERFQQFAARTVQRMPELADLRAWSERTGHDAYITGGRVRGLYVWIERQLGQGKTLEQLDGLPTPSYRDLSILDSKAGTTADGPELADRDAVALSVSGRSEAKRLGKEVGYDLLPADFYWATVENPGPTLSDTLVAVAPNRPDGSKRTNIISPRGGIRDSYDGTLRWVGFQPDLGSRPPEGVPVQSDPKKWEYLIPRAGLHFARFKLEFPHFDQVGVEGLKEAMANYSGDRPPEQLERERKVVEKMFILAGKDASRLAELFSRYGLLDPHTKTVGGPALAGADCDFRRLAGARGAAD